MFGDPGNNYGDSDLDYYTLSGGNLEDPGDPEESEEDICEDCDMPVDECVCDEDLDDGYDDEEDEDEDEEN